MILKPLVKSINEGWTPQHLFQGTDLGLWYDISDISTLFQDRDGNVPVTDYGQPVGLILDKSQGAKRELVHEADFETKLYGSISNGNGSSSTWTRNNVDPIEGGWDGKLEITVPGDARPILFSGKTSEATVGYLYEMEFDYRVISGNMRIIQLHNGSSTEWINQDLVGEGKFRWSVIAKGVNPYAGSIVYFGNSTGVIQIDNIKVYETRGHHASQPTTTKRAIYARMPRVGVRNILDDSDNGASSKWMDSTPYTVIAGQQDSDGGNKAVIWEGKTKVNTYNNIYPPVDGEYTLTLYVKSHPTKSPICYFLVQVFRGSTSINKQRLDIDLSTGAVISGNLWGVERVENGFYKLTYTFDEILTTDRLRLFVGDYSSAGIEDFGIIFHKAQLEAGTVSTPHQTRVSKYDVYEHGQVHVDYLEFDGVDDWYTVSPMPNLGSEETKSASVSKVSAQSIVLGGVSRGYLGFLGSTARVYTNVHLDGVPGTKLNPHGSSSNNKVGILRKTPQRLVLSANTGSTEYLGQITDYYPVISNFGAHNSGSFSPTKGNVHQALAISRFITDEETNLLTKYIGSKAGVTEYVES